MKCFFYPSYTTDFFKQIFNKILLTKHVWDLICFYRRNGFSVNAGSPRTSMSFNPMWPQSSGNKAEVSVPKCNMWDYTTIQQEVVQWRWESPVTVNRLHRVFSSGVPAAGLWVYCTHLKCSFPSATSARKKITFLINKYSHRDIIVEVPKSKVINQTFILKKLFLILFNHLFSKTLQKNTTDVL